MYRATVLSAVYLYRGQSRNRDQGVAFFIFEARVSNITECYSHALKSEVFHFQKRK